MGFNNNVPFFGFFSLQANRNGLAWPDPPTDCLTARLISPSSSFLMSSLQFDGIGFDWMKSGVLRLCVCVCVCVCVASFLGCNVSVGLFAMNWANLASRLKVAGLEPISDRETGPKTVPEVDRCPQKNPFDWLKRGFQRRVLSGVFHNQVCCREIYVFFFGGLPQRFTRTAAVLGRH